MNTLRLFSHGDVSVPGSTSWSLADLGEFRGQQILYTRQASQRLKALREHALIESTVSSNRIEGVTVETRRVRELMFGTPLLRDRDEEEVRGYRDALALIHEHGAKLPISEETIRRLHRMARGEIWDAGQYKQRDSDIIERHSDGSERVRFRTVPAAETRADLPSLGRQKNPCNIRKLFKKSRVAARDLSAYILAGFWTPLLGGRTSSALKMASCFWSGLGKLRNV